ncbi:hypothetical protein B1992_08425 [Pseudoxanthomonas broegbernensis]|uniref:Uncharacterized protein n=1 Tax=Pseudoxanthomonas broegbernensis TaxID=83619 RepID=A0A7V8GM30_9GAMM|nr:hypothetical protein B1992_08425 [Pseudoxanthomonas broegbernensis]MBB6063920.1 hypothetical protein [Pseudoxanthomonas broegbernensis]
MGLEYLGITGLPKYNYQLTGRKYAELCEVGKGLAEELRGLGLEGAGLLDVDYFIWEELQVEENLSRIGHQESPAQMSREVAQADPETAEFIHNEVKDKLAVCPVPMARRVLHLRHCIEAGIRWVGLWFGEYSRPMEGLCRARAWGQQSAEKAEPRGF